MVERLGNEMVRGPSCEQHAAWYRWRFVSRLPVQRLVHGDRNRSGFVWRVKIQFARGNLTLFFILKVVFFFVVVLVVVYYQMGVDKSLEPVNNVAIQVLDSLVYRTEDGMMWFPRFSVPHSQTFQWPILIFWWWAEAIAAAHIACTNNFQYRYAMSVVNETLQNILVVNGEIQRIKPRPKKCKLTILRRQFVANETLFSQNHSKSF